MGERRVALLVLGCVLALAAGTAAVAPANARPERPAPVGSDPFVPGAVYRGDFPDPTVFRYGNRYFAAGTSVSALSLPMMTSTDLHTWTTRPAPDAARPHLNEAMPHPASWAQRLVFGSREFVATWAPSIVRIGRGASTRFVAAYSVPRASDGRRCLSLARSASPAGPYYDASTAPLTCVGAGAIDPQLFVDHGVVWLLLKAEGAPDRILVTRMNPSITGFVGFRTRTLLVPKAVWEGSVVENPAMIRFHRTLYLFYSGNGYGSTRYATGYAVCKRVTGPCKRRGRILSSYGAVTGPGGATPIVDTAGRLRLAYHAWRTGSVGYPRTDACLSTPTGCAQRRMYVATLGQAKAGRLRLLHWS